MENRRFRQRKTISKFIHCPCGGEAKLIQRRNYPHGRASKARYVKAYICKSCTNRMMLQNQQEVTTR